MLEVRAESGADSVKISCDIPGIGEAESILPFK
jgi:hypothetical protein